MTPPKVDISALKSIQLGNLDGIDAKEKAALFRGTDLVYDPKTDTVDLATANGKGLTTMEMERAYIEVLRGADADHDNSLDLGEIKNLLKNVPSESAAAIDPKQFLNNIKTLMDGRYNQLGKNFESFRGQLAFGPTLDALNYYNDGLLSEGYRHANAVLPPNGIPTKSLTNVFLSPWSLARSLFGKKDEATLVADKWAMETAKNNHAQRSEAIGKLKAVIQEGMSKNEKWALEVNIDEALKKLDGPTQKLLVDQLAAKRLHQIMTTEDPKERYKEMQKFADKERPGFGGFGTGNTSAGWFNTDDLWNISGHRHNTVFARTMYHFLATKAKTDDAQHNTVLRREAKTALFDSQGDGGGFNNLASIGFTGLGCGIGYVFTAGQKVNMSTCVTDYRDWGDEEMIDMPGRALDGVIMMAGANSLWNRAGQFRKLRGLMSENTLRSLAEAKAGEDNLSFLDSVKAYGSGYKSAAPVWWQGAKTTRPWNPLKWFRVFGEEKAYNDAIKEAEALSGGTPVKGWLSRKVGGLFKGLPELSAEQKALLAKAGNASKKGFDFTKAFCVLGIASMADSKLNPPYDPFPIDRQVDFERYPDPTKPAIVGGKK